MSEKLPLWCKEAKKALVDKDLTMGQLADLSGISREYTSKIMNGRVYSPEAVRKISEVLEIKASGNTVWMSS